MTAGIEKLCPIWPTRDVNAAEAFYRRLGFRSVHKDEQSGYLIIKREMAELHLFRDPGHDPQRSTHGGYMRPRDIDALSEEWAALGLPGSGVPRLEPAEDKPWGMREMALVDLDGHRLRAGLEIPDWSPAGG